MAAEAAQRRAALAACRACRFCLRGVDAPEAVAALAPSPRPSTSGAGGGADPDLLSDMFGDAGDGDVPLPLQVMACVSLEVFPTDGMPSTICNLCRHFMDQSYKFKQICKQADESLRHYISQGELPESIAWPPELLKYLPESLLNIDVPLKEPTLIRKSEPKPAAKRPVGRPRKNKEESPSKSPVVKVLPKTPAKTPSKQKINMEVGDEDEGYEASGTTIKVTQLGDEVFIATDDDDEDAAESELYDHGTSDAVTTGVYPCNKCQRSFPLLQLLDIHVKQVHSRERKFACKICKDRAFFTKYDLNKHELTHNGVKPYSCNACDKSFLRPTLLQRHVKTHTSAVKYLCSHCDQTFLTSEELSTHVERRHARERSFPCPMCPKKFAFKQGMERHVVREHSTGEHQCDYCEERFHSSTKLQRHIQKHAGDRRYPCKFCPKSFLLPHHYTRHLRTIHLRKKSGKKNRVEGVFGRREDCYKCSQCDKAFTTQDDLIFHSAIHATEDLICPLCNEKFDDVDGVTNHIKSHIEGDQYLCDWCEFLFTSEEKLDMHIDSEHQDIMTNNFNIMEDLKKIEGKNTEGNKGQSDHSTDEEDELYESTQQAEAFSQSQKGKNVHDEATGKEIEVEVNPDGTIKITSGEVPLELEAPDSVPTSQSEDEHQLTYAELKPVNFSEISKRPTEIVHKQINEPSKLPKISKADQEKRFLKTAVEGKSSNANSKQLKSPKSQSESKEPPSRTTEKSLLLLERDINELQKNAKSSSPQKLTSRFTPYKSTLQRRDDKNKLSKSIVDSSPEKNSPRAFKKIKSDDSNKLKIDKPRKKSEIKRERVSRAASESSSDDSDSESNEDSLATPENVRRSARPSRASKVKNYASLIRDGESEDEEGSDGNEERLHEEELEEQEYKPQKSKPPSKAPTPLVPGAKRGPGRPRKNPIPMVIPAADLARSPVPVKRRGRPPKQMKAEEGEKEKSATPSDPPSQRSDSEKTPKKTYSDLKSSPLMTPTGQRLKMLPAGALKSLPPGVKPLPLPPGVKPLPLPPGTTLPPGVQQMKFGKKVVRVQKIVMTKSELDAIQKKGLIEMKDGAMLLKAGIKLPEAGTQKGTKYDQLVKSSLLGSDKYREEDGPPAAKVPKIQGQDEQSKDSTLDEVSESEANNATAQSIASDFLQEVIEPNKNKSDVNQKMLFKNDRSPKPTRFESNSDDDNE